MGYYLVKRDQDVEGTPTDFYFYENETNVGTEDQAYWGTDSSLKKIFSSTTEAEETFNDTEKFPPNFEGAVVVSE
jgi:hypothetical protein|tara:strand:- start:537 stop:761 length:225 start_codon:yes stop_codon:yes gene_type:complete